MINFIKKLPDWIYKKKCYVCSSSKENSKLCSFCLKQISFLPFASVNNLLNTNIYAASFYEKNLQKIIRGLKYHKQKELAFYLAKIMFTYWQNLHLDNDCYIVLPVPMFKEKIKKRKYNHMDLVAKEFCLLSGYEPDTTSVQRIKDTKPQYNLTKKQREKNLKDAFKILPENLINKKILILDDITTTGSTIEEIIKELQRNNISNIVALTASTPNNPL